VRGSDRRGQALTLTTLPFELACALGQRLGTLPRHAAAIFQGSRGREDHDVGEDVLRAALQDHRDERAQEHHAEGLQRLASRTVRGNGVQGDQQ
jgi:hypothetical protein